MHISTDIVDYLRKTAADVYPDRVQLDAADEIERLRAALKSIERHTAPSTRTFDGMMKDMGMANDLAHEALMSNK